MALLFSAATAQAQLQIEIVDGNPSALPIAVVPFLWLKRPGTRRGLVIGGVMTGMSAALDAAAVGYEGHLVEKEAQLGGHANLWRTANTVEFSRDDYFGYMAL